MQEAFLQAFTALDRLRDPDRFGAWLAGIVRNVSRAAARQGQVMLLADWPESLHPPSTEGMPSAEDLDRVQALRIAVAGLPEGQRQAVKLYYYADLPAGQIGGSPGAAKASLHKARRRLRAYITAHRPDLIPVVSRRAPMIGVRITHVQPQREQRGGGRVAIGSVLVVLTDDAGQRALPIWLNGMAGHALWRAIGQPSAEPSGMPADIPPGPTTAAGLIATDLASRLLRAAAVPVTSVDIDELGPDVFAAHITVTSPAGPQQVTVRVDTGLALAAAMDAPVRVADALMTRMAMPVTGEDLPGQFLARRPARQPRPTATSPQNLAFTSGLDGWIIGGSFQAGPSPGHWQDYSATAADGAATLRSAVPQPHGDAFLGQEVFADDYRGTTVTFRAQVRAEDVAAAELWLHIVTWDRSQSRFERTPAITGSCGWATHELTAQVFGDAGAIRFGLTLTGPGQVGLRQVELTQISQPDSNTDRASARPRGHGGGQARTGGAG